MTIAYTMTAGQGALDGLLAGLAERLAAQGLRLAGVVQYNTECGGNARCDMDVKLLPDGPVIRISQALGPNARGCRLDPAGLERAVGETQRALDGGADLLIVNKFGKHEAGGRGFRPVIAAALEAGVPVLVGLNPLNLEAFQDFAGGLAQSVPPDGQALADWCTQAARSGT